MLQDALLSPLKNTRQKSQISGSYDAAMGLHALGTHKHPQLISKRNETFGDDQLTLTELPISFLYSHSIVTGHGGQAGKARHSVRTGPQSHQPLWHFLIASQSFTAKRSNLRLIRSLCSPRSSLCRFGIRRPRKSTMASSNSGIYGSCLGHRLR